MFERYTDRARRVIVLAQEEAVKLGQDYIGTEHILLGLIREGEGVAYVALESLRVSINKVRREVLDIVGKGLHGEKRSGLPFTIRGKKSLELALRESLQLGHNYIGTEHILLGLIREGEGVASQVLLRQGVELEHVRARVVQLLTGYVTPLAPGEMADENVSVTVRKSHDKKRVSVAFPVEEVSDILEVSVSFRDKEGLIRKFVRKLPPPKQ